MVATLQITAEQILRESRDLQEKDFRAPSQLITNEAEQAEYRLRKRKEFEDNCSADPVESLRMAEGMLTLLPGAWVLRGLPNAVPV